MRSKRGGGPKYASAEIKVSAPAARQIVSCMPAPEVARRGGQPVLTHQMSASCELAVLRVGNSRHPYRIDPFGGGAQLLWRRRASCAAALSPSRHGGEKARNCLAAEIILGPNQQQQCGFLYQARCNKQQEEINASLFLLGKWRWYSPWGIYGGDGRTITKCNQAWKSSVAASAYC